MLKWTDANGQTHIANEQIFSRSQLLAMIRPKGKWISNGGHDGINFGRHCSLCNKTVEFSENFCPNCGADMRGKANG